MGIGSIRRRNHTQRFSTHIRSILDAPAEHIRDFQLTRIREVCEHAYAHTQFYRERFDAIGLRRFDNMTWEQFQAIPVLTKDEVREQLPSLVSNAFAPEELRQTATGGTTKSPTTFFIDWEANDRRWAATREWDRRIGYQQGQKVAYLWGASQDFAHTTWKRAVVRQLFARSTFLPASPLDDVVMEDYFRVLRRWRPRLLQAYPSALTVFAEFLLRKHYSLAIPCLSVTAEPLQPDQAEVIARAFGRLPFNWYGAREAGRIATECNQHAGMHVNAYGAHVEIDRDSLQSDSGAGRILFTDLWNLGMPLIRYDIGDVGSLLTTACRCGSQLPRIMQLDGRTTDVFVNGAGRKIPGVAFTNRIITSCDEIREMQFEQTAIGKFAIRVVPGKLWKGTTSEAALLQKLNEFMQEPTEAEITLVDSLPREASGKLRFCISRVGPGNAVARGAD